MESITTFEEAVEFVNQFVKIEDFFNQIIDDPNDSGFSLVDGDWRTEDMVYRDGSIYYKIGDLCVRSGFYYSEWVHMFIAHGLNFCLRCADDGNSPIRYRIISITDEEAGIKVGASRTMCDVTSPFVDSDGEVLALQISYGLGREYARSYRKDGVLHCRSQAAYVYNGKSKYHIDGKRYNKNAWETLRR
jgi:hypothetical protein